MGYICVLLTRPDNYQKLKTNICLIWFNWLPDAPMELAKKSRRKFKEKNNEIFQTLYLGEEI